MRTRDREWLVECPMKTLRDATIAARFVPMLRMPAFLFCLFFLPLAGLSAAEKPNIIFILCDAVTTSAGGNSESIS